MGTGCIDASSSNLDNIALTFDDVDDWYDNFCKPIADKAIAEDVDYILMAAGTPYIQRVNAGPVTGERELCSLIETVSQAIAYRNLKEEFGLSVTRLGSTGSSTVGLRPTLSYEGVLVVGSGVIAIQGLLDFTGDPISPHLRYLQPDGTPTNHGNLGIVGFYSPLTIRAMKASVGYASSIIEHGAYTTVYVDTPAHGLVPRREIRPYANGAGRIGGRVGKCISHFRGSSVREYQGDETESETLSIIDRGTAQEADIDTHKDKPCWVGVYRRGAIPNSFDRNLAILDMLRRAGFTNVKYYYRGGVPSANATTAAEYAPFEGREFDWEDIPALGPIDCFMHLGHASTNLSNGAVSDSSGITGVAMDALFDYLPGGFAYHATSFPVFDAFRALKTGGQGGPGDNTSSHAGPTVGPSAFLYGLLQGMSMAHAQVITNPGGASVHGDPLFRPFKDEANTEEVEWWPPPGFTSTDEASLEPLPDPPSNWPPEVPPMTPIPPEEPDPDPEPFVYLTATALAIEEFFEDVSDPTAVVRRAFDSSDQADL